MSQIVVNFDNLYILKTYPDNYFDAVVTDPPYGLGKEPNAAELMQDWIEFGYHEVKGTGFMGKEWDAFVPQPVFWKEVFRVLKHGGHVLSFFGTRTYDWGVMSMRFAGFEVRDCIQWLYGSGFPKSHNIGKAIDKMEGAEREVVGQRQDILIKQSKDLKEGKRKILESFNNGSPNRNNGFSSVSADITAPSTDAAKQWEGWGTALKPANEPIVLARKPLEKGLSVAENILKWGTGGINIDASRIGFKDDADFKESTQKNQHADFGTKPMTNNNVYGDYSMVQPKNYEPTGRFPANIILDEVSAEILDEQSGVTKSQRSERGNIIDNNVYGKYKEQEDTTRGHNDKGGASRFFYVAKASKSERNKGLYGFEAKEKPDNYIMPKLTCSECGSKRIDSSNILVCGCNGKTHYEEQNSSESKNNLAGGNKNFHPTVKPIKLMQYLVKMVTPPKGKVLDPFCGSGTTGIACKIEGFDFVGIEQDAEYFKIAKARIKNYTGDNNEYQEDTPEPETPTINNEDKSQLTLF